MVVKHAPCYDVGRMRIPDVDQRWSSKRYTMCDTPVGFSGVALCTNVRGEDNIIEEYSDQRSPRHRQAERSLFHPQHTVL